MAWFFAPPRACTRFPVRVPRSCTYAAIGVEPTKDTAATSGWSSNPSTATLSPCRTLNTPAGSPASAHISASSTEAEGSRSLGLSTNVLPQAMATGNIHIGTIAGKLKGVMPATTPSGSRKENVSTSVDTWSEKSPLSRLGIPHANSTTSRPRCTSPSASERTLPCSSVISSAISPACALRSSRKLNITFVRRLKEVCDHSRKASFAAAMAACTSASEPRTTSACCRPVAGLYTGPVRSPVPAVVLPAIQCSMVLNVVLPSGVAGLTVGSRTCCPAWSVGSDSGCLHHEHRQVGLEDHGLRDTAQQRLADGRTTASPDDQQVRGDSVDQREQRAGQVG